MGSSASIGLGKCGDHLGDSSVSFIEYMHHAAITHADDRTVMLVHTDNVYTVSSLKTLNTLAEKIPVMARAKSDRERYNVLFARSPATLYHCRKRLCPNLAVRTATWGAVFFLITTDILDYFSMP